VSCASAVFERTGVESSTRVEDDVASIELNAKFQFEDAARAAPVVIHELTLLEDERVPRPARRRPRGRCAPPRRSCSPARRWTCSTIDDPPRGCLDAVELLEHEDPVAELVDSRPARRLRSERVLSERPTLALADDTTRLSDAAPGAPTRSRRRRCVLALITFPGSLDDGDAMPRRGDRRCGEPVALWHADREPQGDVDA
jgi:hypothetical protein